MQKLLKRYEGRQVCIIYMDRYDRITKRRIVVRSVDERKLRAYCCERLAPRIFDVSRVLAIDPVCRPSSVQA